MKTTTPPPAHPTSLLTVKDVADRLRVCTKTVGRLMAAGALPTVKVGRATRIPVAALEAYISANTYS
jgi:excisionase family DNA binding protein